MRITCKRIARHDMSNAKCGKKNESPEEKNTCVENAKNKTGRRVEIKNYPLLREGQKARKNDADDYSCANGQAQR